MIGLGCMRLSTAADRDDERGIAVIRAALDAGATLLDTADAYCLDEGDVGHNERLIARALAGWRAIGCVSSWRRKAACAVPGARGWATAGRSTCAKRAKRAVPR